MVISSNTAASRKDRRRQERSNKKRKHNNNPQDIHPIEVKPEKSLLKQYERIKASSASSSSKKSDKKKDKKSKPSQNSGNEKSNDDPYANLPADVAEAMRRDDEEIAALEAKMGLNGSTKEKNRLYKEYAKEECYGDDFGDFLDSVDSMVMRVVRGGGEDDDDEEMYQNRRMLNLDNSSGDEDDEDMHRHYLNDDEDEDEDEKEIHDDEAVPMNDSNLDEEGDEMKSDSDDSNEDIDPTSNLSGQKRKQHDDSDSEDGDDDDRVNSEDEGAEDDAAQHANKSMEVNQEERDDDDDDSDGDESGEKVPDHNVKHTYRPARGEDIYGNPIEKDKDSSAPKKYIPPHLRKKEEQKGEDHTNESATSRDQKEDRPSEEEEAKRKTIRRSLNNALNRLSEDTLISVSQALAQLYQSNPTPIVNECIWTNLKNACVERPHLMTGLIPVYVACVSGVHFQMAESAQVGEYVLEMATTDLWKEIRKLNKRSSDENNNRNGSGADDDVVSKEASNLMLVLCYLYNYGIVHCSFMYAMIRAFIESFQEIEIELLLLILSHCGRALRSDDPSALKEIVILVHKRSLEIQKDKDSARVAPPSSRVEYMVSAIMDLKNNKKRQKDTAYADKVSKIRKLLGQIKSSALRASSESSSSLRIGLDDILNVGTKGRWWKVGASWVGNQHRFQDGSGEDAAKSNMDSADETFDAKEDAVLLKLAAKARMNTDAKRAVFCIIMKSADCEDAFEKLTRAGHLKNRKERETVRVLMECCGNEKSYNPFYAHLAARMCDYQQQCRFSMQLAYWDIFKQFDDSVSIRKAANLSKLLFHLVVVHPVIKLGVLKALDMSSPDDLTESTMIFLTIFFTNLLEYFDDPLDLKRFVEAEVKKKVRGGGGGGGGDESDLDDDDDAIGGENADDGGGLGPSISIFLLETLKNSPKYEKGSKFRLNLKAAVKACDTEDFFM